jgi:hypothetical protein
VRPDATLLAGVAFVAFLGAALLARRVPALDGALDSALAAADAGSTALVLAIAFVNAVAEEHFFRGALPIAVAGDHRPAVATVLFVLVTAATLNLALVVAAAVMGTIFMLERLATQGLRAPSLTHVTWSSSCSSPSRRDLPACQSVPRPAQDRIGGPVGG